MRVVSVARKAVPVGTLVLALALGAAEGVESAAGAPPPAAAREFVRRLAATGRAEASLTRRFVDPIRGTAVTMHGRLVLEPPANARLEFKETGERVTLRADGGEWLQPQLEQMLRFDASGAMGALRWWTLFGESSGTVAMERRVDARTYVIHMPDAGVAGDSARVVLGDDGLPRQVRVIEEAGGPVDYELGGWKFSKARGRAEFVLEPPAGYEVFDLR